MSSAHIRLEYSEGVCRLIIDSITVDDEAEYMCEARNEHGVANTWAEVLVESKPFGCWPLLARAPALPLSAAAAAAVAWTLPSRHSADRSDRQCVWNYGVAALKVVARCFARVLTEMKLLENNHVEFQIFRQNICSHQMLFQGSKYTLLCVWNPARELATLPQTP